MSSQTTNSVKFYLIFFVSSCILFSFVKSDAAFSAAEAAAAHGEFPPPVGGGPGPIPIGGPSFFGGPGFGFHKNLDAGFGFGGGGGDFVDGGVPPPFSFGGPSYYPGTFLGSALGAKGDLLFPLVMIVFFIVGVWTIIQFLLGLIVPLIASKFHSKDVIFNKTLRSVSEQNHDEILAAKVNQMTPKILEALYKNYNTTLSKAESQNATEAHDSNLNSTATQ